MPRSLPSLIAALALLAGCAGEARPAPPAPAAEPAVLPQARAALDAQEYAAAIALAGPWATTSAAAASLVASAHERRAEAALRGLPDSAAARRDSFNELVLAMSIAPKGELRDQIAVKMADLARASDPPSPAATAVAPLPAPAQRPQPARPTARPQPARPVYAVAQRKSFEGSGASGRFESCVDVQVIGKGGPVAGAVVGVNNGEHSYQSQTDGSGYTGRCGLGASTWSVVLFWTPGGSSGVATTVYLSGAPEQRAAVVFQER